MTKPQSRTLVCSLPHAAARRGPQRADRSQSPVRVGIKAAKRTEREFGKKNPGPRDDFEWGMINGKLSALRLATIEICGIFERKRFKRYR